MIQLSLFEEKTPARFVAEIARGYWTTSMGLIIKAVNDGCTIDELTKIVKEEYCPYGYAGHYGFGDEYNGYDLTPGKIWIHTKKQMREFSISWRDLAEEIADMVETGEYKEDK